jgi:hypothetical protein
MDGRPGEVGLGFKKRFKTFETFCGLRKHFGQARRDLVRMGALRSGNLRLKSSEDSRIFLNTTRGAGWLVA